MTSAIPAWHPHWDVWLVVLALAGSYLYAITRLSRQYGKERGASPAQVTSFLAGVVLLWIVSGWPIHDIAERQLFSFHMIEHIVITLAVPPLLLLGTPRWLADALLANDRVRSIVRAITRPVPAFVAFNTLLVAMHWPVVITNMVTNPLFHFTTHGLLFLAAIAFWMPVLSPTPLAPRISAPAAMLYLFAASILPTVPASFLTFGSTPVYPVYGDASLAWGIDPVTDQTISGLIMKLGGGALLWSAIAIMWFRWARSEKEWDQIERDLRRVN